MQSSSSSQGEFITRRYERVRERWRKKLVRRLDRHFGAGMLGSMTRVATEQPIAALTFDDGPHPENTHKVLEILADHDAKATFFMLGERVARYPEVVEAVAKAGHTIGNHSWDHQRFPHLSSRQRRASIQACQKVLGEHASNLLRPPFGDQDLPTKLDTLRLGLDMILWDVPGEDWFDHSGDEVYLALQSNLRPGSVILMHDRLQAAEKASYTDRRATFHALERLLAGNPDYTFITIPDLMQAGKPMRQFRPQIGDPTLQSNLVKTDD